MRLDHRARLLRAYRAVAGASRSVRAPSVRLDSSSKPGTHGSPRLDHSCAIDRARRPRSRNLLLYRRRAVRASDDEGVRALKRATALRETAPPNDAQPRSIQWRSRRWRWFVQEQATRAEVFAVEG